MVSGTGQVNSGRKLEELVMYAAERLRDHAAGGATKLNKVLAFSEDEHMRRHGRTITGAEYMHLPWGPVPRQLLPVRTGLCERGEATLVKEDDFGQVQDRLLPNRPADTSVFDESDMAVIDDVIERVRSMSGREVSDVSRQTVGWMLTKDGETIDPALAFLRPAQVTPKVRARACELSARHRRN